MTRRGLAIDFYYESRAEELIGALVRRAGGPAVAAGALYRKTDYARANAKKDPYALKAWCWKVLADASEALPPVPYKRGSITLDFLGQLARLSWSNEGPRLAKEFLAKHGISLVVVRHLPRTYLDGAALKLADGTPVVGLTLQVHPAIVAGKIRHEEKNYRLLSHFVGTGEVRRNFDENKSGLCGARGAAAAGQARGRMAAVALSGG